ncbi:response regulator transcription factor [archaeon]|jgi:hypothetical protein|nr:response regulator transcription factor [archaeon]MBT4397205.1 response regulator transcription factor [archaeon]MBT4440585.1 response regulator transcription factor [archaeon]
MPVVTYIAVTPTEYFPYFGVEGINYSSIFDNQIARIALEEKLPLVVLCIGASDEDKTGLERSISFLEEIRSGNNKETPLILLGDHPSNYPFRDSTIETVCDRLNTIYINREETSPDQFKGFVLSQLRKL